MLKSRKKYTNVKIRKKINWWDAQWTESSRVKSQNILFIDWFDNSIHLINEFVNKRPCNKIGFKTIKNSVISVNGSTVSSESVGNKTFLHICAHWSVLTKQPSSEWKLDHLFCVAPIFLTNLCNLMISCHPFIAAAFGHCFERSHFCCLHLLCCFDHLADFEQNFQMIPVSTLEAAGHCNHPNCLLQQHYFFLFTPPYFETLFICPDFNLNSSHSMIRYNSSKLQVETIFSWDRALRRSYRNQQLGLFRRPTNWCRKY